jgi:quaternary ammonium compound-resistance protein SugE
MWRNIMAWVILFLAGLFEVAWAVGLKYTEGFTKFWPSVGTIAAMAVSFYLLSQALKTIPVGTGYAIWTGTGAIGTVLVGILFFDEPREIGRIVSLLLILSGVLGLKLVSHY